MFPPQIQHVRVVPVLVWGWQGDEAGVGGKITDCRCALGSSHETPIGVQHQCWAQRLAARFNSPNTLGEACKGTQASVRISPISSGGGEAIHLLCGDFKRTRGLWDDRVPHRPVKFHNKAGWRYRQRLGRSQCFHISERVSGGAEGRGSANQFGAGPMSEETGRSGKNGSKINLRKVQNGFREPVWNESMPRG